MSKSCSIEGCTKKYYGKTWCAMHYQRNRIHGDPNINLKPLEYHGLINTPEYPIWQAMKNRCRNPKQDSYKSHGARGIKVCERWEKFSAFYEDMGPRPNADYSIDRINNDGNYEPGNCRWATIFQQSVNKGLMKTNTSGYIGVSFHKKVKKWRAYVTRDYKVNFFGLYTTPEEAAYVRDQVALQVYGDDAVLNF